LRTVNEVRFRFATQAFLRALDITARFAAEGREGKSIGAIFVVGEIEELRPYLKQLILNPVAGHPKKSRNIHSPEFFETLRELAGLDGAFIVNPKGTVESAGTSLSSPMRGIKMPHGLGARHTAAAAITASTQAVAIALSQSSHSITLFHEGRAILELERPGPTTGFQESFHPPRKQSSS
jgi:DNA integrity scanning protein DisA with diadenylate cyclase activity